jgi:glycosyltransferase involved in cell wall biosynthesis
MKISFPYTHGGSGSDVWTTTLAAALKAKGVETEVVQYPRFYQNLPYLLKFGQYKTDADIIHTNSWTGIGFYDSSKPHVATEHHVVHDKLLSPYKNTAQKIFHEALYHYENQTLNNASCITVPSQFTQQKVKESFNKQSELIYNGVDTDVFTPFDQSLNLDNKNKNKIKLFFVGNLSKRKGADLLPNIMKKLGKNFVLYTTLGQQNKKFDWCDNIISVGKVSLEELVQWYNYCDIFLSPSRMEGFGLTICEAMACAKPVITTNVTAMPELVTHQKGGYLCKIDDVNDFVDKIKLLSECKNTREKYGEYNYQKVESSFTLEKMVSQYIERYETLL